MKIFLIILGLTVFISFSGISQAAIEFGDDDYSATSDSQTVDDMKDDIEEAVSDVGLDVDNITASSSIDTLRKIVFGLGGTAKGIDTWLKAEAGIDIFNNLGLSYTISQTLTLQQSQQ